MCTVWAVVHTHSRTRIHVRNPDRVLAPLSCVCCLAGPWTASVCLSSNEPGVRASEPEVVFITSTPVLFFFQALHAKGGSTWVTGTIY